MASGSNKFPPRIIGDEGHYQTLCEMSKYDLIIEAQDQYNIIERKKIAILQQTDTIEELHNSVKEKDAILAETRAIFEKMYAQLDAMIKQQSKK